MGWEWLPAALESLRGIEPYEVVQALDAEHRWPRHAIDPDTGIEVLTIWARTRAGRALVVAGRRSGRRHWDWDIIGARELRPVELTQLQQWEARHGD